ncbi:basic amino acid ABC transporter substrate-binding protein [Paenibacillus sp. N1-5-1-14]|uniref:basic amino acid ABC transporter substrate-binding protein n=1 Tax=Paenibacillus radicibacter TaxID=2972488 RepID=UPI002158C62A|nr:basic amino acid ABC transporter substrate-binding protein [Paenibacillus radicibacter]MCR8641047.1 basic amino acid ABC transporter substrate-binding protein [Paenibacillus radicibacter]
MKKGFLLALAATVAFTLTGCGSKAASGDDKKYVFATDAQYAPMENMDKDKIVGFDVDFLDAVMKEAGVKYELKNIGWDTLLESVKQGKEYHGAISSVSITDERKATYDYSAPYFESINMILVKEDSPVKSAADLKEKKVAVQISTTADTIMGTILGEKNPNLKKFDSNAVALMELEKGGVDAVVADVAIVREYLKNNPNKKFKSIEDTKNFTPEYYAILLPKGSELKAKLDPAIKKVVSSGTYKEIYKKWMGVEPKVDSLLK